MDKDYDPRVALIEAETRYRVLTADEPDKLEAALRDEEEKLVRLKQKIDQDIKGLNARKREMLSHQREAKFYQDKIDQSDQNKLTIDLQTIRQLKSDLNSKKANLNKLRKCLGEFNGIEPTNSDLKQRINELKESRLNLEMTFLGDSP